MLYFFFLEILNPEGHPNCFTGSKVTAILLNGWILPISGASAVKGLRLQPVQQACFCLKPISGLKNFYFKLKTEGTLIENTGITTGLV